MIPGLAQWVKDLALLWLWHRLAAVAPIRPLAWEPPFVVGASLKKKKKSQWRFLDVMPKAQATKVKRNIVALYQTKNFCTVKETIDKIIRQSTEWKKTFASHIW